MPRLSYTLLGRTEMKILLASDYYQTPIGYAKTQLAQNLKAMGHKVLVVTSNRYFPFPDYESTVAAILGPRKRVAKMYTEAGITVKRKSAVFELFSRCIFFGIGREIDRFKPDLVIVYGIVSPTAILTTVHLNKEKNKRIPLVLADSHLPSELAQGPQLAKKILYWVFRMTYASLISKRARKIVAAQEGTTHVMYQTYGIHKPTEVISNGTDLGLFYFDKSSRKEIRKKYSIPINDFVIVYSGKIIPTKGIDILIKAFSILNKKYPNTWCLLVGDGSKEYKEAILQSISSNTRKNIIVTGMLSPQDLRHYYSAADVGVWPLQESLAMIDAAACKLPIIANDKMQAQQRLGNNNGLLYKQRNFRDLAHKLELLLKDPKKRQQMGLRGYSLVKKKFSWRQIAQQYIDLQN
jgi:glycosyltransferase involved in cell wall biosynthesis